MLKASAELIQEVPIAIVLQKYQEKITNELKKILKYEESRNLANSMQTVLWNTSGSVTGRKYWTGTLHDSIKPNYRTIKETPNSIMVEVGPDPNVTAQTFRGKRKVANYAMPVEMGHKTDASYRLKQGRRKKEDIGVKTYVPGYHYVEGGYLDWKKETGPRVINRLKVVAGGI